MIINIFHCSVVFAVFLGGLLTFHILFLFQYLIFIVVAIGSVFCFIFHIGTKEKRSRSLSDNFETSQSAVHSRMAWKDWLKCVQFYQVGTRSSLRDALWCINVPLVLPSTVDWLERWWVGKKHLVKCLHNPSVIFSTVVF